MLVNSKIVSYSHEIQWQSGGCSSPHSYLRTQIEGSVAIFISMTYQITFGVASIQGKENKRVQRIVKEICLRTARIVYMHVPLMRIQPQDHDCERRLNVLIQAGKLLQSSSSIIGKVNLSFWWKPCCLYNLYLCVYNLWLLHSSWCWHILSFVPKAVYLGLVSMFL